MPSSTEPRSGLKYGWILGESGWSAEMQANLLRLGRFGFHPSVKDRDLATPPGTPAAGDTYIVAAAATGAWAGKETQVALWDGAAWVFGVPRTGWTAVIEGKGVISTFSAGAWSAGIAIAGYAAMQSDLLEIQQFGFHLSVKDRDLATPPGTPTAGDTYIVAAAATGAWVGKETQVALWDSAAWVFAVPRTGWLAHIEDEQKLTVFRAGAWSAGIAI